MKLGIALSDLGPSQLNFLLIKGANALVAGRSDLDVVAFYETLARPCLAMNFAAMQLAEGFGFDGVMLATTLSTAEKLLRFPACSRKLFFAWDLEWLRLKSKSFAALRAVYGNPELTVLARCRDHADALRSCWGREPVVVEDFDLNRILEVARE